MAIFEDIKLSWKGKEHVLPADSMLRTIAQVEDVLSIGKLYESIAKKSLPMAKLAICYGIVLRAAGAEVSDDEVYDGMFANDGESIQRKAFQAIGLLQSLMLPPSAIRSRAESKGKAGEATGPASSPNATSSSSAKDG